ncbi:MAG: HDOD domain-containing protein [Spirochaetes bacterium]|nr:HDOD domain-containing protein [Spirochaetota bacterium]
MGILDKKTITDLINRKQPFSVSFKYADSAFLMMVGGIFVKMLTAHDQLYLLNSVISIIREVMANAQKANAKRLYFAVKGLNINRPDDYNKGMERFKVDFMYNADEMSAYLLKSDFTVTVDFSITENDISIGVTNNAALNQREKERIGYRVKKAEVYKNLMDAYEDIQDESEGAGLGIAMIMVTLRNIGIDRSLFTIKGGDHTTTVSLNIPRQIKPVDISTRVKEKIVRDVRDLPPFPTNVVRILDLCDDPDSSLDSIAGGIMSDPAITTGVMKLSNSAGFISGKRIESVLQAVRILGIRNIRSMVLASSARRIIEERYSKYEEIWEHSNRVGGYARGIGSAFHTPLIAEKALLAGLLHDLGKIILLAADPDTAKTIARQVKNRKLITETFMEEISIGISHSTIGGLIAEKWNFPDYLTDAIRRHHDPLNAGKESEQVAHAVYLANLFCGIETDKYEYYYCYESILEKYGLADESAFNRLHESLKKDYES